MAIKRKKSNNFSLKIKFNLRRSTCIKKLAEETLKTNVKKTKLKIPSK